MDEQIYLRIGRRIKEIRLENRITLNDIAIEAGVSKGLLSKIENGRTVPSLPVLIEILKVLKADMADFFGGISHEISYGYVHRKASAYEPEQKEYAEGFQYFSILNTTVLNAVFQSALLKLSPGAKREKVVTDGFTFLFMIEGTIKYLLEEEVITLETGDSLFFDGKIPHVPQNLSGSTAIILIIYLLKM
jgi:transcriptional regulator with XRE-family HTH domain